MIKRATLFFLTITICSSLLYAGAVIEGFHANTSLNKVELKWTVKTEDNVKNYTILRSLDQVKYKEVKEIKAKWNDKKEHTYTWIDDKVFKSQGNTFYYKIKIINQNGSTVEHDKVLEVSPQISATRHTWGSIKAMFR